VFELLLFCLFDADWAEQKYYLRQAVIPFDQLRLRIWYERRGYREAVVDTATTQSDDGGAEVLFRIREGRPVLVDAIEILGAEGFEDTGLLDDLPLSVGDPLSDLLLSATQDTLSRRLQNQGYAQAGVLKSFFIPAQTPFQAQVSYDVAPGPRTRYGHIEVAVAGGDGGEPSLTQSDVLKTLQFRTGDLYRVDQILEAQARLYGLEVIRSASVTVRADLVSPTDSVVPMEVQVQEGDVHRVRAGGGWSSAECIDVESRWISRNFKGGGRRLQVRGRLSNLGAPQFHDILCPDLDDEAFQRLNWLAAVDFAQPWVFSTRNSFSASLYGERQSLPDAFVREALGLSLAITRNIGPRTPLTLSYQPELSRTDAAEVLFCTSFLVCSPDDIANLQGANWLSPVGLNFTRNHSNNLLNPTRGYTTVIDVEHAAPWTGSDFRYDRIITEGTWYERLAPRTVLAARLRAGWVGAGAFDEALGIENRATVEGVHPQKRFYGGGANSVRGFAHNRLGPLVLTTDPDQLLGAPEQGAGCTPGAVMDLSCDAGAMDDAEFSPRPTGGTRVLEGSVEVRFPLTSILQGVAFTDFGQVWDDGEVVSLRSTEVTPGMGLRILSPIGPIRFDVAYRFLGGQSLPVVTPQIRPWVDGEDPSGARIVVDGEPVPYVSTDELVVLVPRVVFGDSPALSLSRFQLHISIGQAF
jgi:outer membrane protein assembly factor BamA